MSLATSMNGDAYRFLPPLTGLGSFIPGLPRTSSWAIICRPSGAGASARLLLPGAIALHDHEFGPGFRVVGLFAAPSEMRLGNVCVGCAREGPLGATL